MTRHVAPSPRFSARLQGLADREDGVAREGLVDDHARDAHHRGAAVVALGVKLPRLAEEELLLADLLGRAVAQPHVVAVGVARPREALRHDVAGRLLRVLLEEVDLQDRDEDDDLEPRGGGQGGPRGDRAAWDVGEQNVLRRGEVAREADARVRRDGTEEASHSQAAVLDLHLDKAAVAGGALLADFKRVPAADGRQHANLIVLRHEGAHLLVGVAGHIDEGRASLLGRDRSL